MFNLCELFVMAVPEQWKLKKIDAVDLLHDAMSLHETGKNISIVFQGRLIQMGTTSAIVLEPFLRWLVASDPLLPCDFRNAIDILGIAEPYLPDLLLTILWHPSGYLVEHTISGTNQANARTR